jgi:Protein of unknown function (DUF4019)
MRKIIYVTILLGLGSPSFFETSKLQAIGATQTPSTYSNYTATNPYTTNSSKGATSTETKDQAEMAAWMLEGTQAAKDYIDKIDRGQYSETWPTADPLFQNTISQSDWANGLTLVRKPLGRVLSRTLKDQKIGFNPQGFPPGAYMGIEYDTSFENSPNRVELITLRRAPDGHWRVITYQVI